ncbi:endonuclease/exonuclease/phosphatase family protein [Microvirga massiliensis]|uniref:endonuclease/exonuclease/phosphatase family protein n=1 Tax=Microvirga massiliensis TaxID=1033741 RepID=UPI00062BE338|nr:endonuclease/exonuclease/phosphatase family protein [Microvirga massiliensis]
MRTYRSSSVLLPLLLWIVLAGIAQAQEPLRIATYNIRFLNADTLAVEDDRHDKLKQVIEWLEADIIGLQEIKDRAALEALFPPAEWSLVIVDESPDEQDLAVAVRRPLRVMRPADLNADDEDFLFSGVEETFFPNRRDVLSVEVAASEAETLTILVTHAKSRLGGRAATDVRREGAATRLVQVLERDFDEKNFILLGDFNDTPDDRSLNILETGGPNAPGMQEDEPGSFLINLTEPLYAAGHVTIGRTSADVAGGRVRTLEPGARAFNNRERGRDTHTGDQMFDQLLVPVRMRERHVANSTAVFDLDIAALGTDATRASDHLPVYADFIFRPEDSEGPPAEVSIVGLLPNPPGPDEGREGVLLAAHGAKGVDLAGRRLRDKAGNEFGLDGSVEPETEREVVLREHRMPLNNDGDVVELLRLDGTPVHRVSYTSDQVQEGQVVRFQR